MNDANRTNVHEAAAAFRLDRLEERLNALFADEKKTPCRYPRL
jgi:hypothetical protein